MEQRPGRVLLGLVLVAVLVGKIVGESPVGAARGCAATVRRDGRGFRRGFMHVGSRRQRTLGNRWEYGRGEHAVVAVVADVRLAHQSLSLPSGITRVLGSTLGAAVLFPHGGIAAIEGKKLLVVAPLRDGAGVQDDDLVGMGDGRQSMTVG